MSMVQQAIEVSAPLHTVYEQLAAFENYPRFMTGVQRVTPIGNRQAHWVMDVDGHRREFDAQITELSFDERVSWSIVDGPLLSETITVRPMGETRTQVVAQLEADIAFLMPSDRHGRETLNRRLKDDLSTFKDLIESGRMGAAPRLGAPAAGGSAGSQQLAGRSGTIFSSGAQLDPSSPSSVAARIRNKPHPGAGTGSGAIADTGDDADPGTNVDPAGPSGIDRAPDHDMPAPGRRIATRGAINGGAAGAGRSGGGRSGMGHSGSAPMGGRTPKKDAWGDGMINEEDRGSAHDL